MNQRFLIAASVFDSCFETHEMIKRNKTCLLDEGEEAPGEEAELEGVEEGEGGHQVDIRPVRRRQHLPPASHRGVAARGNHNQRECARTCTNVGFTLCKRRCGEMPEIPELNLRLTNSLVSREARIEEAQLRDDWYGVRLLGETITSGFVTKGAKFRLHSNPPLAHSHSRLSHQEPKSLFGNWKRAQNCQQGKGGRVTKNRRRPPTAYEFDSLHLCKAPLSHSAAEIPGVLLGHSALKFPVRASTRRMSRTKVLEANNIFKRCSFANVA